ncbi:MAG: hypothetical protein PVF54_03075 [Anaerolineae bacterium]|jgi:hypothetical protein
MYPESEILFAPHCIPELRDIRGPQWAELVDRVASLPDGHVDVLGFALTVVELSSCLTCDLDSYRATLGCCTCAQRSVSGFKGSDEELIALFEWKRYRVREYVDSDDVPEPIRALVEGADA